MGTLACLLCLTFYYSMASGNLCSSSLFEADGHFVLGGLFSFGTSTADNLATRSKPELVTCERFYDVGFVFALAMRFAVEEINNSTSLLPGIQLGYQIFDTCFEPLVGLQPSMLFLTRRNSTSVDVNCNYTDYEARVIAVVGPMTSQLCLITGKLFSFFMVPQVSYAASRDSLSDRELFPSFFRTIPSDRNQMEAIVKFITFFKWNWVAVIGSDDEYGHGGLELFSSLTWSMEICTAFEGIIPTSPPDPGTMKALEQTVKQINNSQANIIVLFADEISVGPLLEEWIRLNLEPKVWLASDGWATSQMIMSIPGIQNVGTILGFTIQGRQITGFYDYVISVLEKAPSDSLCWTSRDGFFPSINTREPRIPHCRECEYISLQNISITLSSNYTYSTYTVVYSIAHSLHKLLKCDSGGCLRTQDIKPFEEPPRRLSIKLQTPQKKAVMIATELAKLLKEVKEIQFLLNNHSFYYDDFGNLNTGCSIVLWYWNNESERYTAIGDYTNSTLNLDHRQIRWYTLNNKVPQSSCNDKCLEGQIKRVRGFDSCCYDCIDCKQGFFQNGLDDEVCAPCPPLTWSPARSTQCYDKVLVYLFWLDHLAVLLLVLIVVTALLILAVAGLFLKNLHTPLVQASGGKMCFTTLLSLLVSCGTCITVIGKPNKYTCAIQQPLLALSMTGCLASLLIKSVEILLAAEFPRCPISYLEHLRGKGGWLINVLFMLIQGAICLCYLYVVPSEVQTSDSTSVEELLLQCAIESWVGFALLFILSGILGCTCFLCTFMVETLPKMYNFARGITRAMLMYFIAWTLFLPTYSTVQPSYKPAVQVCVILLCNLGILGAFFFPKCYLLWFKPEQNTTIFFGSSMEELAGTNHSQEPADKTSN